MFYKILGWGIAVIVAIALLGKVNSNSSLYSAENNAVEFIFPVWNWGRPWLYVNIDSSGVSFQKPDDLPVRFAQDKYDTIKNRAFLVCKEKGESSHECEEEENNLDAAEETLDIAKDELQALIEEKGDNIRLSKEYKKDEFSF